MFPENLTDNQARFWFFFNLIVPGIVIAAIVYLIKH